MPNYCARQQRRHVSHGGKKLYGYALAFPFWFLNFCIRANWNKNCCERRSFCGKNAAVISLIQHSGVFSATELSVPFARPPKTDGVNVQFANEQDAKERGSPRG